MNSRKKQTRVPSFDEAHALFEAAETGASIGRNE